MILEITSTHGVNWGIENPSLLSIGTEMSSLGPVVKNMGFLEKLYDKIEFDYMYNDDLNIY